MKIIRQHKDDTKILFLMKEKKGPFNYVLTGHSKPDGLLMLEHRAVRLEDADRVFDAVLNVRN